MTLDQIVSQFSKNRLGGEPVPKDLQVLLRHRKKLAERTGYELDWRKSWAPWLDTSYLSKTDWANPGIAANVRAIHEVCSHIAFVAAEEDGQYIGYWRGARDRKIVKSPLVFHDNEGQFSLCASRTFAETILAKTTYDEKGFAQLRDWLRSIGILIRAETAGDLSWPDEKDHPRKLHDKLYDRYRK